ncbi:MAG TPA: AAA family ATPase [Bacteroidales bacterium]|nr:AAA family ATPase [Bacteroidales bacterium]
MEQLKYKSNQLVLQLITNFSRYLYGKIDWSWRLNSIIGARGTGKTTLLLQRLKNEHGLNDDSVYVSLDDFYFSNNRFYDFAEDFHLKGGKYIFADEVHKYKNWSQEIKNIYDTLPGLNIVFTGSSIIDIRKQDSDLSRRAIFYYLTGLSFREYLSLADIYKSEPITLDNLIHNHVELSAEIIKKIKPLQHFENYLKYGYYPYFYENPPLFYRRLEQTLMLILENDLNFIQGFDYNNIQKIKQLLYILSVNVPFKPNILKLSEKTKISRNTLLSYLHYLEKAQTIQSVYQSGASTSILQKPEKIYLNNTNLSFLLASDTPDKGTLRETFFLNQLRYNHLVESSKEGDFFVDNTYVFEIGGKNKTKKQIQDVPDSYVVADNIEIGAYNKIPLWLFGFLY